MEKDLGQRSAGKTFIFGTQEDLLDKFMTKNGRRFIIVQSSYTSAARLFEAQ